MITTINRLLLLLVLFQIPLTGSDRPSILFILADDLGWSDLGCYGNDLIDTAHIDGLAEAGMRFKNAYGMPVCTPTRVSMQSGKNPATLKIQHPNPHNRPWGKVTPSRQNRQLPLEETTIAETLATSGYTSFHVGKWGSGRSRPNHGYAPIPDSKPTGPYADKEEKVSGIETFPFLPI